MVKLVISLSGSWVLSHREDDILPVDYLIKVVGDKFAGKLEVEDSGITELVLNVKGSDSADTIVSQIRKIFCEHYSLADDNSVLLIKTHVAKDEVSSEPEKKPAEQPKQEEATESTQKAEEDNSSAIEKALEEINKLVGAEEFKALAKEIVDIAPQIIKNKTFDILSYQAYLFSVNDGYGLTTYLSALENLLKSLNINGASSVDGVVEETLPAPKGDGDDLFDAVSAHFRFSRKNSIKIICIDISEWINKTNSRSFKKLLVEISKHMSESIIIFRVPFVDKEVLNKIRLSLNDLMFIRTISIAPFDKEELQACANTELERYGFTMSDEAWQGFHSRIAEEKRDGKFYGVNTVRKVVKELLYKKQLSNARGG